MRKTYIFLSFPSLSLPFIFTQKTIFIAEIQTIWRNLALKELELKEASNGKQVAFSIKFVTKNGELVFMPRAVAESFRFDLKSNRMRGVVPIDA